MKGKMMIKRGAGSNDVGEWGEKEVDGAYSRPLMIGGEPCVLEDQPALSDVDGGKRKAPLAPPGTP